VRKYAADLVAVERPDVSAAILGHGATLHMDRDLSWLLRMTIIDIECYVQYAVWETLHRRGLWTPAIGAVLRRPFSTRGRGGTCGVFYHSLPSLISAETSLKKANPALWEGAKALYREVRNPLFHGKEAVAIRPAAFASVITHLTQMYAWIDTWCLPEWVFGTPTASRG
jgi:hypothetical protein